MGQLYTIGHSTFPQEHLIELLKQYKIDHLLDVRSMPYSRYASQYNSDVLKKALLNVGIKYTHMAKSFGARQEAEEFYPEGYLDFELFRKSPQFIKGRDNVIKGLEQYNVALMCTEKNPIDCHRAIMVARGFELAGVDVKHILHDGGSLEQKELNKMLVDRYFPERGQLSFFQEENKTEEEYLEEAYRMRNSEIGYRRGADKEGGGT